MQFTPCRFRIVFDDSTEEIINITKDTNEFIGKKAKVLLHTEKDQVIIPLFTALETIKPKYMNIEFDIPEEALDDDFYYYYSAFTTNDITSVFQHAKKPQNDMKDIFVAKNVANASIIFVWNFCWVNHSKQVCIT